MPGQRDRDLVRLHWPAELRPAFDALLGIDDAMAEVVSAASQPALAAIKLAWWREALERIDKAPAPAEPRLQAVASELLPRGISGGDLAKLETGWAALLQEYPDQGLVLDRGTILFGLGARLLGGGGEEVAAAGRLYVAGQLKRRGMECAAVPAVDAIKRVPRRLRPITALGVLGRRDLENDREPEATPSRAWALIRHRLTGR